MEFGLCDCQNSTNVVISDGRNPGGIVMPRSKIVVCLVLRDVLLSERTRRAANMASHIHYQHDG